MQKEIDTLSRQRRKLELGNPAFSAVLACLQAAEFRYDDVPLTVV